MNKYLYLCLLISSVTFACDVSFSIQGGSNTGKRKTTLVIDNKELIFSEDKKTPIIDIAPGSYTAVIYEDYQFLYSEVVTIDCVNKHYSFTVLSDVTAQLNEVVVTSQTIKQKLESTPFSVQVIDVKKEYGKTGDVGGLLNTTTGIKVRTDGNLGSTAQINLGGLQGKAIRIFKDGIPIELFGHGFNIGTIPTNMLERVEVYKGAMPIYLASDALGGGINLVMRNPKQHTIEASYEIGSFNTHRGTVNAFITGKNPSYYFGVNTAYNYSDNNYKIEAPFVDPSTTQKYTKEVKRFHDKTKSYYGEVYTGIRDKKWTDDVRLSFLFSDFYKEIQNDSEMGKVYGKPLNKEKNYGLLLSYKKELFDSRVKLHYTVNYSHFKTRLIDTATTRYNWDGDIILSNQIVGEINRGGSDQHIKYDLFSNRLSISYDLSDKHIVEFGELFYYQHRKGSDPLGAVSPIHQVDVLTIPAFYQKNITALAVRSRWLDKALESIVGIKYYAGKTEGFTTDKFNFAWSAASTNKQWGYLTGVKWSNKNALLKLSYEYATRLPDEMEVFGDGVLIKENLDLLPEKSHNINVETRYTYGNEKNNGTIGATLFYRRVQDAIFLQPDIPYNRYINFHNIAIKGFEFEVSYNRHNRIDFGMNLTYQDIRRVNEKEEFKIYEGARVSNIPFLFGNLFVNSHFEQVFTKGDRVSLRWNLNYVHRFYLTDIPKSQEPPLFGNATDVVSKLVIPNDNRLGQFAHDLGVYYQFAQKRISTSFEVHNITNAKLYDNFNVQKPGRSFHFKVIYKII